MAIEGRVEEAGSNRKGRFVIYKRPWDALGPYGGHMELFCGRQYNLRLRAHAAGDGSFWYEGFATAVDPADYARDQALARYPERPDVTPPWWDLWPCQLKLNPMPAAKRREKSPDLIGEIWLSESSGRPGGEVLRLFADYRRHPDIAFAGGVVGLEGCDGMRSLH